MKKKTVKKKNVEKKSLSKGIVHILATFNNTIITVSDFFGNAIFSGSAGFGGMFKGSKRSTPFAAQMIAEDVLKKAFEAGLREVHVRIKGQGIGKDSAVRAIENIGVKILSIADISAIPHNGCRPPKKRRV